ncbi:hypothetical protein, partial [Paracoccus sp. FO-3]|uniref:hypothetical protein n=1 Tax=Paracoccus sp. FO-3 TaxID=1335059 RepID=UPI001C611E10
MRRSRLRLGRRGRQGAFGGAVQHGHHHLAGRRHRDRRLARRIGQVDGIGLGQGNPGRGGAFGGRKRA